MKKLQSYSFEVISEYRTLRRKAGYVVQNELHKGRLKRVRDLYGRPTGIACTDCDNLADSYDHRDYLEPTKVEAVCHGCNIRRGLAILTLERLKKKENAHD